MVPPHLIARLQHEENLRQQFNQWLASGQAARMEAWQRPAAEKLLDRMDLGPHDRTLEIGCGEGWAARLVAQRSPDGAVVGIDLADDLIASARAKSIAYQNILFAPGSAEEIPWAEDYFTHVVSIESAYYWHSPELAFREMFRVTAWGGRVFLLMSFYAENLYSLHWKEYAPAEIHLRSTAEWKEVFSLLGFVDVEHDRIPDDTPVPPDFEPDIHWRSRDEKEAFNREGALLITARKPPIPEPGPLASEPNPLRILN
ncbi:MAG: class I SAM-dependent methyltransferase [Acidobacteria bacterium]|nr:class I SAM-dependent methyltransferase [Acidobacteriota bacterium]